MIPLLVEKTLPSLARQLELSDVEEGYLYKVQFAYEMAYRSLGIPCSDRGEFDLHFEAWETAHKELVSTQGACQLTPPRQDFIRAHYFLRQTRAVEIYGTKTSQYTCVKGDQEFEEAGITLRLKLATAVFSDSDGTLPGMAAVIQAQPPEFWTDE